MPGRSLLASGGESIQSLSFEHQEPFLILILAMSDSERQEIKILLQLPPGSGGDPTGNVAAELSSCNAGIVYKYTRHLTSCAVSAVLYSRLDLVHTSETILGSSSGARLRIFANFG